MSWKNVFTGSMSKEEQLDFQSKYWENASNSLIGPITFNTFKGHIEAIFPKDFNFNEQTKVLDFACGTGRFYQLIKDSKCDYFGLDISFLYLTELAKGLEKGILLYCKKMVQFPFPDNFFDFSFAGSIFTHLGKVQREFYLNELKRTLKPNGYLIISFFDDNDIPPTRHSAENSLNCNFIYVPRKEMMELINGLTIEKEGFLPDASPAVQKLWLLKKVI